MLLVAISATACSGGSTTNDSDSEPIGVFIENSGSGNLVINDVLVSFCYENEGCIDGTITTYSIPAEENTLVEIGISDAAKITVGVRVSFRVATGLGSAQVIEGAVQPATGMDDFEPEEVLKTITFQGGENVAFEYGQTGF